MLTYLIVNLHKPIPFYIMEIVIEMVSSKCIGFVILYSFSLVNNDVFPFNDQRTSHPPTFGAIYLHYSQMYSDYRHRWGSVTHKESYGILHLAFNLDMISVNIHSLLRDLSKYCGDDTDKQLGFRIIMQ